MPDLSGRDLLREWEKIMRSMADAAASVTKAPMNVNFAPGRSGPASAPIWLPSASARSDGERKSPRTASSTF